jgi:hypothetical protein
LCQGYARPSSISFIAFKAKCLVVISKSRNTLFGHLGYIVFSIDNEPISFVKSFSHLGHLITSDLTDDADIIKRCGDFIGQVNNTIYYFRKLNSFVQNKLFQSYCTTYYGGELWLLSNRFLEHRCVAEEFKTHMASSAAYTLLPLTVCLSMSSFFLKFFAAHSVSFFFASHVSHLLFAVSANTKYCMLVASRTVTIVL